MTVEKRKKTQITTIVMVVERTSSETQDESKLNKKENCSKNFRHADNFATWSSNKRKKCSVVSRPLHFLHWLLGQHDRRHVRKNYFLWFHQITRFTLFCMTNREKSIFKVILCTIKIKKWTKNKTLFPLFIPFVYRCLRCDSERWWQLWGWFDGFVPNI